MNPTKNAFRHQDIRAAHAIIECLMLEAERVGIEITYAEVFTFKASTSVHIDIHADYGSTLASLIGLNLNVHFKHENKVIASFERRIGRWQIGLIHTVGTVEKYGYLLDSKEED